MALISTSPAIRICLLVGALMHLNLVRGRPLLRITSLRLVWKLLGLQCDSDKGARIFHLDNPFNDVNGE